MTHPAVPETVEEAGGRILSVERPGNVRLRGASFGTTGGRGRAVFLSGYTEFIEKNLEPVGELVARGFEVVTLDWRGQGLSDRLLAERHKGHIDRLETHLADLEAVLDAAGVEPGEPLTVIGHSMGGHMGLRYCLARPERVRRAVLVAPMFGIAGIGMPGWLARGIVEAMCLTPLAERYVFGGSGYGPRRQRFDGNRLTHDRDRFDRHHRLLAREPDLIVADPTFTWVRAAFRSIAGVLAPGVPESIRIPVLLALAGRESIVSNRAIERMAARIPNATLVRFDDAKHEIMAERDPVRHAFWAAVDSFLTETDT